MSDKNVYDKNILEFVAVAVEFCAILEGDEQLVRSEWIEKMLKILPLLYLKAQLLPKNRPAVYEEPPAGFVKESDYHRVATLVSDIMGDEDIYLDVFIEDMIYSDRPISASVSEGIADIYQDVRDFISVYQYELYDQMESALTLFVENFYSYWGQKLLNLLRPLHRVQSREEYRSDSNDYNIEGLWG